MNKLQQGYILHEDRTRVIIATGFKRASKNVKTGAMIQIWIIRKDMDPLEANRSGRDVTICGSCPLKGIKGKARTCYVDIGKAPLAIYRAFRRGGYSRLEDLSVFDGRAVRFGAYGDPVFIPFHMLQSIATRASSWTGYTHQWRKSLFSAYRGYLMASVEDSAGMQLAHSQSWRTFRVVNEPGERTAGEIACVNESRGVQCADCGLCAGSSIKAKSITINVHGNGKGNFGKN